MQRRLNPLFQRTFFLSYFLFWRYINSQVRINKIVNIVGYYPCSSRLISRIHFHIFINSSGLDLSPECLLNFLSNSYISQCAGKVFKFMVFPLLENALNLGIFTHASSHSKLVSKLLSSHQRQRKVTFSPVSISSKICLPQQ